MISARTLFLFLFLLLAATPLLFMWLGETLSAHRCLEAGGSFNYQRMVCDFESEHARPPFSERHGGLLVGTVIAMGVGVVLWWWAGRRPTD